MSFARPESLLMILLLIPTIFFARWGFSKKRSLMRELGQRQRGLAGSQIRKYSLVCLMIIFLAVVAAGPKMSSFGGNAPKTGKIALLFDVSKSMGAKKDLASLNRLERAKVIASDIVDQFPAVNFAIYAFTKESLSYLPFTKETSPNEIKVVLNYVLGIESVPKAGSGIGRAINNLVKKFPRSSETDAAPKFVILFSDGEPTESMDAVIFAATQAGQAGIKIIAVGVGEKEGATVPLYKDGKFTGEYGKSQGVVYVSYLKEEVLRRIAQQSGGAYFFENDAAGLINFLDNNLSADSIGRDTAESGEDISLVFLLPFLGTLWFFLRYYV